MHLEDQSHFSFKFELSSSVDIFLVKWSISEQKELVAIRGGRSQDLEQPKEDPLDLIEARGKLRTSFVLEQVSHTFKHIGHEVSDVECHGGCQFLMFWILGDECASNVKESVVSEMKHSFDLVEAASERYSNLRPYLKEDIRYGLLLTVVDEVRE